MFVSWAVLPFQFSPLEVERKLLSVKHFKFLQCEAHPVNFETCGWNGYESFIHLRIHSAAVSSHIITKDK